MSLSYSDFIKLFPNDTQFVKILNDKQKHHNFTYKIGLNEDILDFNPKGSCAPGGLYFTTMEFLPKFVGYGVNVAYIELLPDAVYYCDPEGYKWKTDKFKICKIEQLEELSILAVQKNPELLKYIKNKTVKKIFIILYISHSEI